MVAKFTNPLKRHLHGPKVTPSFGKDTSTRTPPPSRSRSFPVRARAKPGHRPGMSADRRPVRAGMLWGSFCPEWPEIPRVTPSSVPDHPGDRCLVRRGPKLNNLPRGAANTAGSRSQGWQATARAVNVDCQFACFQITRSARSPIGVAKW
jgi:hypothetical protein